MKKLSSEKDYKKLVQTLIHHDHLYYEKAEPEISDYEYDQLFQVLLAFEKKYPDKIDPNSPSHRVSDPLTEGFQKKSHKAPMLSLANTYSEKEVEEFIKRVKKLTGKESLGFSVELKMDGVAISVLYKNGKFVQALTRGNGQIGDDVTNNMKTLRSIPLKLSGENIPESLEIRGEVYMPLETFQEINQEREENGLTAWANPRNATAGSLKLLDPKEVSRRRLKVVFYGLGDVRDFSSQFQVHLALRKMGLPTAKEEHFTKAKNLEEIFDFAKKVEKMRDKLPFEIDGIVIKVDELSLHERLGITGKCPRSSVAYKFEPERAKTAILAITLQMGRTGVLTPVAELKPTQLSGSTISRATLHNQDEINRKDIRIGDVVFIEKGGDVIPKVVEVCFEKRADSLKKWQMPKNCPFCQTALSHDASEVAVRCTNPFCPEIQLQRLTFYVSKQGMDIPFLGTKVMRKLYEKKLVSSFSDLYRLKKEDLEGLENFKEKSINNLLQSIERSKKVPLHRLILALGIKYVGKQTALLLEEVAGSLNELFLLKEEDLLAIDGVGEKAAKSIVEFFQDAKHIEEIQELLSLGLNPTYFKQTVEKNHIFSGKSFVLTGTLSSYTRDEAVKEIQLKGGVIKNSVSKKTDYLLLGEDPGSKYEKALKLQITILTEEEFKEQLKGR